MKWPVIVRPRAEADLREAPQWYDAKRAGLGDEFWDEVKRAIGLLEEQPDRRPPYYRDFRRVVMRRFPYKVFYRVETDRVVVFRVLHAKRDHPRWLWSPLRCPVRGTTVKGSSRGRCSQLTIKGSE